MWFKLIAGMIGVYATIYAGTGVIQRIAIIERYRVKRKDAKSLHLRREMSLGEKY